MPHTAANRVPGELAACAGPITLACVAGRIRWMLLVLVSVARRNGVAPCETLGSRAERPPVDKIEVLSRVVQLGRLAGNSGRAPFPRNARHRRVVTGSYVVRDGRTAIRVRSDSALSHPNPAVTEMR
jgi:hypothetical protein